MSQPLTMHGENMAAIAICVCRFHPFSLWLIPSLSVCLSWTQTQALSSWASCWIWFSLCIFSSAFPILYIYLFSWICHTYLHTASLFLPTFSVNLTSLLRNYPLSLSHRESLLVNWSLDSWSLIQRTILLGDYRHTEKATESPWPS